MVERVKSAVTDGATIVAGGVVSFTNQYIETVNDYLPLIIGVFTLVLFSIRIYAGLLEIRQRKKDLND